MILVGRIHIGGKNVKNSWSQLGKYLKKRIRPIERTKAMLDNEGESKGKIKRQIDIYNKKYDTDFFV